MKAIIALFLVFLISNAAASPVVLTDKTDKVTSMIQKFFDTLGLSSIPRSTNMTITEANRIIDLVKEAIDNFHADFVGITDTVSKSGEILEIVARSIVKIANDTGLEHDIDIILDNINDMVQNPKTFFGNIWNRIKSEPLTVAWAIYDCYNVASIGDLDEFGVRLARVFLNIFKGIPIPRPGNLAELTEKYTFISEQRRRLRSLPVKQVGFLKLEEKTKGGECLQDLLNTLYEIIQDLQNPDLSPKDIFSAIIDVYNVIVKCF